jgi:hypothetical protein
MFSSYAVDEQPIPKVPEIPKVTPVVEQEVHNSKPSSLLDAISQFKKGKLKHVETEVKNNTETGSVLEPLIANKEYQEAVMEAVKVRESKEDLTEFNKIKADILANTSKEEMPKVEIDSGSNSSQNQFFPEPEVTQEEVSVGFSDLLKSLRQNLISSDVSRSPKVSNLGLGTSMKDSPKQLSPLATKPSITNLFDDTMNLFEDTDDDINLIATSSKNITSEIGKGLETEQLSETTVPIAVNSSDLV